MSDNAAEQPKNGHGGARPGAGRPSNGVIYRKPIRESLDLIADNALAITKAQIELALGVTVQEVDQETGGLNVYTKPPDGKTGQYLLNRLMGPPKADDSREQLLQEILKHVDVQKLTPEQLDRLEAGDDLIYVLLNLSS